MLRRIACFLFSFLLLFLSSAQGEEEGLMVCSLDTGVMESAPAFAATPLSYENPTQYQLAEKPISLPQEGEAYLSQGFGGVTPHKKGKSLQLVTPGEEFHPYREGIPSFADLHGLVADACPEPVTAQLQALLTLLGWESPAPPDVYLTAAQAHARGTVPGVSVDGYMRNLPQDMWEQVYFVHFFQEINGLPLAIWMENAGDDDYETRDASFTLDGEGKVIAGTVFPGYQVVATAPMPGRLLTAQEAGERFLRTQVERYDWAKTHEVMRPYAISWRICSFTQGLVLTSATLAMPAWHLVYETTWTDRNTGEVFHGYGTAVVNAVTGVC